MQLHLQDGDITKQTLATLLTDPDTTRAVTEFSSINEDVLDAKKNMITYTTAFVSKMLDFYHEIDSQAFHFITNTNKGDYKFIEKLMNW